MSANVSCYFPASQRHPSACVHFACQHRETTLLPWAIGAQRINDLFRRTCLMSSNRRQDVVRMSHASWRHNLKPVGDVCCGCCCCGCRHCRLWQHRSAAAAAGHGACVTNLEIRREAAAIGHVYLVTGTMCCCMYLGIATATAAAVSS